MKKYILQIVVLLSAVVFSLSGCVEHRYYHENHHHSPNYYHRHNMTPPPGVEIELHN